MLELRAVSPADPEAHAMLVEYFDFRAAEFPDGVYTPAFPDPALFAPPQGVFLLAGAKAAAVGCGGIRRIADSDAGIRYEVKHLFLTPRARGNGWGGAIIDDLERRAREWGAAELVLDTHHSLDAAGGLYASRGFESVEPYNDNPNATRWYRKTLA